MPALPRTRYSSGVSSQPWAYHTSAPIKPIDAPLQRALAGAFQHDLVFPFAKVGVHAHVLFPRELHGFGESLCVAVDGLAGGQHDLRHGIGRRVVVKANDALAVLQVFVRRLQHVVRHGAAFAPRKRIGAAPRVVAYAKHPRCLHLTIHRSLARRLGIAVLVVKRTGAAVLDQIRHRGEGRVENYLVVHQLKNAVNLVQPLRHRHVGKVDGFQVADKGLEKVVMCVDYARGR